MFSSCYNSVLIHMEHMRVKKRLLPEKSSVSIWTNVKTLKYTVHYDLKLSPFRHTFTDNQK